MDFKREGGNTLPKEPSGTGSSHLRLHCLQLPTVRDRGAPTAASIKLRLSGFDFEFKGSTP